MHVVAQWPFENTLATDCKLRAARLGYEVRNRHVRAVELMEELRGQVGLFRFLDVVVEERPTIHLQPVGTPRVVMAPRVEVALSNDMFIRQALDGGGRADVVHDVVVPCCDVGMEEENHVWELRVVVDDVCQIGHGFMTLVGGDGTVLGEVVDRVDGCLNAGKLALNPGHIFGGDASHHENAGVDGSRRFEGAGFEAACVEDWFIAGCGGA